MIVTYYEMSIELCCRGYNDELDAHAVYEDIISILKKYPHIIKEDQYPELDSFQEEYDEDEEVD